MNTLTHHPQKFETGLTHANWRVRLSFAERKDVHLTSEQIRRGLSDPDWGVGLRFAEREDLLPSKELVDWVKRDASWVIQDAFVRRQKEWQAIWEQNLEKVLLANLK